MYKVVLFYKYTAIDPEVEVTRQTRLLQRAGPDRQGFGGRGRYGLAQSHLLPPVPAWTKTLRAWTSTYL